MPPRAVSSSPATATTHPRPASGERGSLRLLSRWLAGGLTVAAVCTGALSSCSEGGLAGGKRFEPGGGLLGRLSLPLDTELETRGRRVEPPRPLVPAVEPNQRDDLRLHVALTSSPPGGTREGSETLSARESNPHGAASESSISGSNKHILPGVSELNSGDLPPSLETEMVQEPASVVALRRNVHVYEHPDAKSTRLGYLRAGALVKQQGVTRQGPGCEGGFHGIEPQGYVCAGEVTTDDEHILRQALSRRANRRSALPYRYGRSRRTPPPLYNRIPNEEEQRRTEPERSRYRFDQTSWRELVKDSVPDFLAMGQPSLKFNGQRRSALAVSAGRPVVDSTFALLDLFEVDSRYFGLSTDLSVLPLDHLEPVEPSQFSGIALRNGVSLPIAFHRARHGQLFTRGQDGRLLVERRLEFREALPLTGKRLLSGGQTLLEVQGGHWVVDEPNLVVIERRHPMPHFARPGATWLDVSIERQTLVAYEGERPLYATLVSTGRDGLDDPEATLATVRGEFRIHTKHVTATMDSDVPGDEYDLRDVPYVQYFSGNYALHATFWHDAFGSPRSHGCINLSPLDARWVFDWSEPRVPEDWHGAMSLLRGTIVSIHP